MLMPKVTRGAASAHARLLQHHFADPSRLTSITMRMPSLSDSSRSALMPSTRFSFTSSAIFSIRRAFVHLIRSVNDDGFAPGLGVGFHSCARAQTLPRPVR